ncbi:uncharacterized protein LOC110736564 [Chenopodium quinoa]|uniref:uncharacterized protein LOC110736564 n=1 Tax=Chenopodium quinoa TaxID=63459 RepID=UPI000B76F821|nr:uncharacterized protein LOC110736564 [Chenopodium quinoa]
MSQNPPQQPPHHSLSSVNAAVKGCYSCSSDDHWILHNIKFREEECRKLCTSCVLKHHPTSFCPICFNLHDPKTLNPSLPSSSSSSSSSLNRTLTCLKCSSASHITCIPAKTPKSPYLCPPCSNPSFKFFDLKKPRKNRDQPPSDGGSGGGGGGGGTPSTKVVEEMKQYIDERAAKVFLLAAKISAMSMSRAASIMRSDAERKATDAALARKRAKEAIDYVMSLSTWIPKSKHQKRDVLVSGSKPGYEVVKMETNGGVHNVGGSGCGGGSENGNGAVAVVPAPQSNGGNNQNNNHVGGNGKETAV